MEMIRVVEKFKAERYFKEFYDNLVANSHDWDLFYSLENEQYMWAERSCGILGNLAAIYRQRGCLQDSIDVMFYYKKRILEYNKLTMKRRQQGINTVDELVCCRELTYKYHRVAINLAADCDVHDVSYDTSDIHKSYRHLMAYEIEKGLIDNDDTNEFTWMLESMLNRPMTMQTLNTTTNEELIFLHYTTVTFNKQRLPPKGNEIDPDEYKKQFPGKSIGGPVKLHNCAQCNSTEPFIAAFKKCGKCHTTRYCSKVSCRRCQRSSCIDCIVTT